MKKLYYYLNPLLHLGNAHYSFVSPVVANFLLIIVSELYAYRIAHNPMIVGVYIVFLNVAFIIYFAFREGLRGAFVSVVASIGYYFYIIYTRNYEGKQLSSGIETTLILAVLYSLLGAIIGWLKQSIDKLVEKEADGRRRLETIIEQLPVGVLITDNSGKLLQRNRQVDRILGIEIPIGFKIGTDVLPGVKIDNMPVNPAHSPLYEAIKTGHEILGQEYSFERNDGARVDLRVNSAPIHNQANKIIAAASIISDVTKQKSLERQKDEFLGIASHELKTPVTSIKAYGQLLQRLFERKGDEVAVDQLKKMDVQINKLTNLIRDLLDVTKIQSGRLELNRERFSFNELVKEVVEDMQIAAKNHKITMRLGSTKTISADRERISQVIINLVGNAMKYSPQAKEVVVTTTAKKNDVITFCVKDFGIGIAKDKQDHVFEQFFRVSGATQSTFPGLGLGLYISSEIVKREHGTIWLESSEGKGATFCFSLPVNKPT